jgi:signal transduction histidine kinase
MPRVLLHWRKPGHPSRAWPVFVLLLSALLVPALTTAWFLREAVESQRDALRHKLAESYRAQLALVRAGTDSFWQERTASLERRIQGLPAPAAFAELVRSGAAATAVIFDPSGRPAYPSPPAAPTPETAEDDSAWTSARRLEESADMRSAAAFYLQIAAASLEPQRKARAIQAAARCLARVPDPAAAIRLIDAAFRDPRLRGARDPQGRLIAADGEMFALQLSDGKAYAIAGRLRDRLNDYSDELLPSGQRLFLMRQMATLRLPREMRDFPTLEPEALAARAMEAQPELRREPVLSASSLPGLWRVASSSGRLVLFVREDAARGDMARYLAAQRLPAGVSVTLSPPGAGSAPGSAETVAAGEHLPGWTLSLVIRDDGIFDELARRQRIVYFWVAGFALLLVAVLAAAAAAMLRRQLRLARLKADLVTTVSHELKTPLASMRLLVDTLLSRQDLDASTAREYLQMIANENSRLSRVIENFLTFSRLERNRQSFEFTETDPATLVTEAVRSAGDRFHAPECRLLADVAPGLPAVRVDRDGIVTAFLNLLDNAWKYSGEEKRIALRAYERDGSVCFEVEDNGIGFGPREARKIFRKFYQIDRRLSRSGGGCGLGLSIVEFIVKAHGGSVEVTSRPGQGSTFRIVLPCGAASHAASG